MAQLIDTAVALLAHAFNVREARRCSVALPRLGEMVMRVDGKMPTPQDLRALLGAAIRSAKAHVVVTMSSGLCVMDDNWVMANGNFAAAAAAATCIKSPGMWHTVEFKINLLEVGLGSKALPELLDLKMSICHVLERVALVNPSVTLTLMQQASSKVEFEYTPHSSTQEAFHRLYGIILEPKTVDDLDLLVSSSPLPLAQFSKMQICIDPETLQLAPSNVIRSIALRLGPAPPKTCFAFWAKISAGQLTRLKSALTPNLGVRGGRKLPPSGYRPATLEELIEVSAAPRRFSKTPRSTPKLMSRNFPGVVSRDDVLHSVIIGQFNREFLCVKTSNGKLLCFDQHAAHERVRFEQFQRDYVLAFQACATHSGAVTIAVKPVDPPVVVFSERALDLLKLHSRGFIATAIGARQFAISQVPMIMGVALTPGDALHSDGAEIPSSVLTVLASKACRGAVFFGEVLTSQVMQEIVSGLVQCDFPFQCAHGRPSVVPL